MRRRIARVSSTRGAPPFVLRRPFVVVVRRRHRTARRRRRKDVRTSEHLRRPTVRAHENIFASERASERSSDAIHLWRASLATTIARDGAYSAVRAHHATRRRGAHARGAH
jgi:hypothetical protein